MTTPIHQKYATACYAVICRDVPGSAVKRAAATPAHFTYIEGILDEILVAGPLFDDEGRRVIGSILILRTQSAGRATELVTTDPYNAAGVWASIEIRPFLPAAGSYVGGTSW